MPIINNIGGGSGKDSGFGILTSAFIAVTYPDDSTITCTTSDGLVLGNKAIDSTHIIYYVGNTGTYTFTATDGTNTKTKIVIVDKIDLFEITIEYLFYTLKNGVAQNGFEFNYANVPWGAGYSVSNCNCYLQDDYMYLGYYGSGSGAHGAQYRTPMLAKSTYYPEYTYLKMTAKRFSNNGSNSMVIGLGGSYGTQKSMITTSNQTCDASVTTDSDFVTHTFLLANAKDSFCILAGIQAYGSGAANPTGGYICIKDIWLE